MCTSIQKDCYASGCNSTPATHVPMYIVMLKPYMCTIPGPAYVHYMYIPNVLLCEIETWGNTWHIHTHDKIQDVRFSAHRGKPPRGSLTALYIASIEIVLHAYAHLYKCQQTVALC